MNVVTDSGLVTSAQNTESFMGEMLAIVTRSCAGIGWSVEWMRESEDPLTQQQRSKR